jgi:Tol biopolymer transport system component
MAVCLVSAALAIDPASAAPVFGPFQRIPASSGYITYADGGGTLSCASASWCAALHMAGSQPAVTVWSGTWGASTPIPLPSGASWSYVATYDPISCPSIGDCTAVGGSWIASESGGTWGTAVSIPPPSGGSGGSFTGVWCASSGNCVAIGNYNTTSGTRAMVASESSGTWGSSSALSGTSAGYASIGCSSLGHCAAVDTIGDAWTEVGGVWGSRVPLPQQGIYTGIYGVGCPSPSTCVAVGTAVPSKPGHPSCDGPTGCSAFAVSFVESSGSWSNAPLGWPPSMDVAGSELASIDCVTGLCEAVGAVSFPTLSATRPAFTTGVAATWTHAGWSAPALEPNGTLPTVPSLSQLAGVACATAAQCFAVGFLGPLLQGSDVSTTIRTTARGVRAPRPPLAVHGAPILNGANVTFEYAADDGGRPIRSYTATANPGGAQCTTMTFACAIHGLVNGQPYVITATDSNGFARSARTASNRFVAGAPPETPSHVHVSEATGSALVTWTEAPTLKSEPVHYVVQVDATSPSAGPVHCGARLQQRCVTTTPSCPLRSLDAGDGYTVLVWAVNASGASRPARFRFMQFVPNGTIAFSAPVQGRSQIFTVNPDGTGLRQITHSSAQAGAYGLSWSPDGRGLLYTVSYPSGPDAMFRSLADGSGTTPISPPCTGTCLGDDNPVYSPDGTSIAFERAFGPIVNNNATGVAIFTMHADGTDLVQLTPEATSTISGYQQPHWSPDGTKIAFVAYAPFAASYVGGDGPHFPSAIEVMNANGTDVRRLTPWRDDASNPSWSPDGRRILFNTYSEPVLGESANLFTMRADGTDRQKVTNYSGGYPQAAADSWSPDGKQIVYRLYRFCTGCSELGHVFLLNLHTMHARLLTRVGVTTDNLAAWGRKPT